MKNEGVVGISGTRHNGQNPYHTSMTKEFNQIVWDDELRREWTRLLELAYREDLGEQGDWTTQALVPKNAPGQAIVVARQAGVLAGEAAVAMTLERFDLRLHWSAFARDGDILAAGQAIGRIEGPARGLLAVERPLLNLLGHLSGIASLTRKYVEAVADNRARIYDTRKTTPGWRRLEKYGVRCGGGRNHRTGLFEAVLIKDNHLAFGAAAQTSEVLKTSEVLAYTAAEAVIRARRFLEVWLGEAGRQMIVEVEVDTLAQFDQVIAAGPDLVLLDNMRPVEIREAVARRDARYPAIGLEASGGINLSTIRQIAETGVDRISVGALTHSAVSLDFGLDWEPGCANPADSTLPSLNS